MNALYISYDGATDSLGQSQIIPYLKGLARKGLHFVLVTFDKRNFIDKRLIPKLASELKNNNIIWARLNYHKNPPVFSTLFDIMHGLVVCLFIAKRRNISVVHARSYVASLIAIIMKKMLGLKFIFDMRGFWADERVEGFIWKRKGFLYWITKFFEKKFLKNADEIVVLSEAAKDIIRFWGYPVNNVSVIPCCTDTDYFKSDISYQSKLREKYDLTGKFVFVHTGSLEYCYMKEAMLDYFKIAKEFIPQAHFLVLSHSDKSKILKLIKDKNLNLRDFTMLTIPFADMPKYLTVADVGLIFITPVFSKRASCPTKFAEYLSCCLPVIINKEIGDLEDYVTRNNVGVVVSDFTDNEYRLTFKKLLSLLNDKDLKSRCRQAACENFSLHLGINKYYEVYSRLR